MANISAATNEKVFPIKSWLGLNEAPDGDTKLKMGEASIMQNWHVTRDGNLKRRPGATTVMGLRVSYTTSTDAEEVAVCQTADDATIACYDSVVTNSFGLLELGNKLGDYTAEEADEQLVSLYFKYQDKFYQYSDEETADGVSTWKGYRVSSVPSNGQVKPVDGLWSGRVAGKRCVLAACENRVWSLWDDANSQWQKVSLGTVNSGDGVHFFPFDGKAYIMTGHEYAVWDGGASIASVTGYIPLVAMVISPLVNGELGTAVSGELNESINLLIGKRRAWLSPDGVGTTFQLPENGMASIDYVKDLKTGNNLATGWQGDTTNGTVTFTTAPAAATNAYEVGWTMPSGALDPATQLRAQVEAMHFSELYAGTQDTRIFLYGDGSNQAIYSGIDYDGTPRADYFPDQNAIRIGDSNSPITQLIRHNSTLVAYKTDAAYSITFGITSLANDVYTPAFYATPINRAVGNLSVGQVQIVGNNPVTSFGEHLYMWKGNQYGNLTTDEKNIKLISSPVQASLKELRLSLAKMFDDNAGQELFISENSKTLVWNYELNAWARYSGLTITCMTSFANSLFFGTADGRFCVFDEEAYGDDGEPIDARWESGAMSFGADYMRKLSAKLWVGMKPVAGSSVTVTVETDRKSTFAEKLVSSDRAKIAGEPFMARCKLKAKKFVYYRLMLLSNEYAPPATVSAVDIQVRSAGYTK